MKLIGGSVNEKHQKETRKKDCHNGKTAKSKLKKAQAKVFFSKCEQAEEMFSEIKLYNNGVWLETAKKISTQQKKFKILNLNNFKYGREKLSSVFSQNKPHYTVSVSTYSL